MAIAHHKVIHLLSMYKGITISELLKKLKITKAKFKPSLRDLIKKEYVIFKKDLEDTRIKHIFLSEKEKTF